MRLMLLGEKLVAFRDSAGRVGVMDHRCPHRCASLFFGRNEEGGLRCVYHGWKFDVDRQLRRHAERAAGPGLQAQGARPRPTRSPSAAASSGSTWARAPSRRRCRRSRPTLLPESEIRRQLHAARVQLAAGARRRHRHLAFRLPACRPRRARARSPRTTCAATPVSNRAPEYHVTDTDWGTMYWRLPSGRGRRDLLALRAISCSRSGRTPQGEFDESHASPAPGCRWTTRTRCSSASSWKQAIAQPAARFRAARRSPGSDARHRRCCRTPPTGSAAGGSAQNAAND